VDDPPKVPLEFANQVIKRLVLNQSGPTPNQEDCRVLRVVYRQLGGKWEPLYHGDMAHTRLLAKVVTNWVQMQAKRPKPVEDA
jgi:hypothetical protein